MKNPEKPKQETIKIDDREIPVTHEDIDLKEFTRRLNEKETAQAEGEGDLLKRMKGEGQIKEEEELKSAREKAFRSFGEEPGPAMERLAEQRLEKTGKEFQAEINSRDAERKKTSKKELSSADTKTLAVEFFMDKLGYRFEDAKKGIERKGFFGKIRSGWESFFRLKLELSNDKGERIIDPATGKPKVLESTLGGLKDRDGFLNFLREEYRDKLKEEIEREGVLNEGDLLERMEKEGQLENDQGDLIERMKREGQIKETVVDGGKPVAEKKTAKTTEVKPEKRWRGIDFKKMEAEGTFGKMRNMTVENNAGDIVGIVKKYGPEISLPTYIERLLKQYNRQKPEKYKFEKAKDDPKPLKEWLAGFLTDIKSPKKVESLRKIKLEAEKEESKTVSTAGIKEKSAEAVVETKAESEEDEEEKRLRRGLEKKKRKESAKGEKRLEWLEHGKKLMENGNFNLQITNELKKFLKDKGVSEEEISQMKKSPRGAWEKAIEIHDRETR